MLPVGIVQVQDGGGGNPLVLAFLVIGLLILALLLGMAIFQRRMYADQIRQVRELLAEARRLADEEGGEPRGGPDSGDGNDPASDL